MAGARKLANMTPEELKANVDKLTPAWAKDYILQLEELTRSLAQQLEDAHQRLRETYGPDGAGWTAPDAAETAVPAVQDNPEGLQDRPADPEAREDEDEEWDPGRNGQPVAVLVPGYDVLPAPGGEYATMRVLDGRADMKPLADLPDGAELRIVDFYQVHYGNHDTTGGMRVLVVEGDGPLQVRPVSPGVVLIARGGTEPG